jgi:hypothetical protein
MWVMKYRRTSNIIAFGIFLSAVGVQSQLGAHEFIIKPAQMQIETGIKLPFRFKATLIFSVN